jgi:hypothetical protein
VLATDGASDSAVEPVATQEAVSGIQWKVSISERAGRGPN